MGFLRRKSVSTADMEENRPRNRLSKPMTSKSPTAQKSPSPKKSPMAVAQHSNSSSQSTLEIYSNKMSRRNSRAQVTTHSFKAEAEQESKPLAKDVSKRPGVASLVAQFESASSTSQSSLGSSVPSQKCYSMTYGVKKLSSFQKDQKDQQTQIARSQDQLNLHKRSGSTLVTPTSSLEHLVDPFGIPKRRESTYRPGEATRKLSAGEQENSATAGEEKSQEIIIEPVQIVEPEPKLEDEQQEWTPPPPIARAETPASLDFKAIGGLRLGSLHVVNGRESPILSELSRHLISKQLREVSSVYADSTYSKDMASETWEDADVVEDIYDADQEEPQTPTRSTVRSNTSESPGAPSGPVTPEQIAPRSLVTPIQSPDKTSMMAQEYMSELQASPFSAGVPSPMSTGSVVHHKDSSTIASSPSTYHDQATDMHSTSPALIAHNRAVTEEPAPLTSKYSEIYAPINRSPSLKSDQPTLDSEVSTTVTVRTRDQIFSSALEYQAPNLQPPPSPERGISPVSLHSNSTGRPFEKVDSGYNSGTSMLDLHATETKPVKRQMLPRINTAPVVVSPAIIEGGVKDASPTKSASPRKFGKFFPFKSVTRKPIPTSVAAPTATITDGSSNATNPPAVPTDRVEISPKKIKEDKLSKAQKKLSKSRPQSRVRESKEIVVQRLPSCESTLDIPAIPTSAITNLQFRSQQVPELEKTFTSYNHIRTQSSVLSLNMPIADIRFPSPIPDLNEDDRSSRTTKKSRDRSMDRPRSKSRRRSFLEMFRSDKDSKNREAQTNREEAHLSIADFGDVMSSLGANPYAIAQSRSQTTSGTSGKAPSPRTNPHNISADHQRKRSSMNDEEASEFARRRSHSFNGRGEKDDRKNLLNDRGAIPGRHLRSSMIETDVPPMPPLPNKDELKRISQRNSLQSQFQSTPTRVQKFWDETPSSDRQLRNSPSPLPIADSPPPLVGYSYDDENAIEDEFDFAPPPPSHSPAPLDVSAPPPPSHSPRPKDLQGEGEDESIWEQQAQAWRARRLSANEALRSHRQSLDLRGGDYDYDDEQAIENEEASYPVISPNQSHRQSWGPQEPGQWLANDHYQDWTEHEPDLRRSQTWNDAAQTQDHGIHDYSTSSFQSGHRRHHTWDERQDYVPYNKNSDFSYGVNYDNHESNYRSGGSNDSRESFYSHQNRPIDRPFDPLPRVSGDYSDSYGPHGNGYEPYSQFSNFQASQARGRGRERHRPAYDNNHYNGYENSYDPQYYNSQQHYAPQQQQQYNGHVQQSPARPTPYQQQNRHQHSSAHSTQRVPAHSHSRPRSHTRAQSRPTSRHSQHSNISATPLADELHPQVKRRPVPAPDYGRYSGGMNFGYEGRENGFGGSAGTRSASGKADAMVKGMQLRGSHGVDLGDVPVIGVLRMVK